MHALPLLLLLLLLLVLGCTATVETSRQIQLRDSIPYFDDSVEASNIWAALVTQVTNMSDVVELANAVAYFYAELNGGKHPCAAAISAAAQVKTLDSMAPPPAELCALLGPLSANHPLMAGLRQAERLALGAMLLSEEEEAAMRANVAAAIARESV